MKRKETKLKQRFEMKTDHHVFRWDGFTNSLLLTSFVASTKKQAIPSTNFRNETTTTFFGGWLTNNLLEWVSAVLF